MTVLIPRVAVSRGSNAKEMELDEAELKKPGLGLTAWPCWKLDAKPEVGHPCSSALRQDTLKLATPASALLESAEQTSAVYSYMSQRRISLALRC